jgi:hypothetical protein
MRITVSDALSIARTPCQNVLAKIASIDSDYKSAAIQAALNVLDIFKCNRNTREFTYLFESYKLPLELIARRDGSFVGWASLLFNCASRSRVGSDQWEQAISMGKELLISVLIDEGETCIPFAISESGCSLHAIGEKLIPNPIGAIISGSQSFERITLSAIQCSSGYLYIDEAHNIVSRFVSDYSFPGGLKARPLTGPNYEDHLHRSDISAIERGVSILSNSWEFGTVLVNYFAPSIFPVLSPSRKENISVSSELFPGWIVASLDTPIYMAECLVHEASHNLLYALARNFQFVNADCQHFFYSPWRPDPRPLEGLLHACFVFCNVIDMYYHISLQEHSLELQSRYRLGAELKRVQICLDILLHSGFLTLDGLGLVEALAHRAEHLQKSDVGILSSSDYLEILRHLDQNNQG